MLLAVAVQMVGEVVEGGGEVGGVGGWIVLGQSPLDGDCFLGNLEGVVLLAVAVQKDGEIVEGLGEVGGVGGWVVLGQGPVEVGGFLRNLESLVASPGSRQTSAE